MATTDPRDVLLAHDRWATANLIEACRPLRAEQFVQRFEMGPGSLQATLTHVLGTMRGWTDVLTERAERRARLEEREHTLDELAGLLDPIADELAAAALAGSPDDVLRPSRGGNTYAFTRGGILTHVTTHGMHHRAQCLNMLRHLGVETLPMSSVMEWMLMAEPVK
ncbi:MAG: hypothetical protein DHS20C14_16150 [Phycisphaeraceae bacterium]|nr:MAG: hypothetical protein DHS20C14_16150 [Phycisphaeraceae bacterium]